MKRFITACACLVFSILVYAESPEYVRNEAIMTRPLATLVAIPYGVTDLVYEASLAFDSWFGLNIIDELTVSESMYGFSFCLGPQFNLSGTYLDGYYIGIYPGWQGLILYGYGSASALFLQTELGYQNISENGFLFGVYTGLTFMQKPQFKMGIKVGWAHPDSWLRIEK